MTSPVCTCGIVHMDDGCPGPLSICITPGFVWDGTIRLTNRLTRQSQDWPAGTSTRIRFNWGTGTELVIQGTVDGPYLRFHMTPAETEQLPRGTRATVDLNYDNGDPQMWRPWRTGRLSPCH